MDLFFPLGMKSPRTLKADWQSISIFHVSITEENEKHPVVFATAAPTSIPLGNARELCLSSLKSNIKEWFTIWENLLILFLSGSWMRKSISLPYLFHCTVSLLGPVTSWSLRWLLDKTQGWCRRVLKGLSVHRDITEHSQPHPSEMLGKIEMHY